MDPRLLSHRELAAALRDVASRRGARFSVATREDQWWEAAIQCRERDALCVEGASSRRDALEQLWRVVREQPRLPSTIDDSDKRLFTSSDVQFRTPHTDPRLVWIQVITGDGFPGSVIVEFGPLERAGGLEWAKEEIVARLNAQVDQRGYHDVVHDMRHGGLMLDIS